MDNDFEVNNKPTNNTFEKYRYRVEVNNKPTSKMFEYSHDKIRLFDKEIVIAGDQ